MTRPVGDMKAGLTSGARPKLTILPRHGLTHGTRAIEYGADKYARGNYHGAAPAELGEGDVKAAKRLLGYLDAGLRHGTKVADAINRALGTGGDLRAAAAIVDDVPGGDFPPSGLPDLSHMIASILIGVTCAVDDGLLPADPGQPWVAALKKLTATTAEPLDQKDDPASERARVAALRESAPVPYATAVARRWVLKFDDPKEAKTYWTSIGWSLERVQAKRFHTEAEASADIRATWPSTVIPVEILDSGADFMELERREAPELEPEDKE